MTASQFSLSRMHEAVDRDDFKPKRPAGMSQGALMALFAHALLIIALAFGVRWHASEPTVISAELWAAAPQSAAPAPMPAPPAMTPPVVMPPVVAPPVAVTPKPTPPPPAAEKPPPNDAEIAVQRDAARKAALKVEQERQQKELVRKEAERKEVESKALARQDADRKTLERKQAEAQKQREAQEARQAQEDEARLAKQRDDQLKRMQSMAGATGAPTATGTAARDAAPSAEYGGRIKARIKPNIVFTEDAPGNPVAEVEVRVAPTGRIVGRRLVKSSGNKAWDDSVLRAIDRTEVLPRDVDGRVPPAILIDFRPNE